MEGTIFYHRVAVSSNETYPQQLRLVEPTLDFLRPLLPIATNIRRLPGTERPDRPSSGAFDRTFRYSNRHPK